MLITMLVVIPFIGIIIILSQTSYELNGKNTLMKSSALFITVIELIICLIVWVLFDNSNKYFQFIQEKYTVGYYDIYLGVDGLSIYFLLLTALIMPISLISNWKSIENKSTYFLIILLLLEGLLLVIFSVLDILMFYIFLKVY